MAREFGDRVQFVSENYGDSRLAKRFGVTRYPAIFVDDVLVATPNDFGFYGKGEKEGGGRYAPLKSAASHERFRGDLHKMIELVLAGRKTEARAVAPERRPDGIAALPDFQLTGLDGKPISRSTLAGKVVLVEVWATWCPPCRSTLKWLGELKRKHGDRLTVLALAVESDEKAVRKLTEELAIPVTWAMGTPEVLRAFGDVSAVPTLFAFDAGGKAAGTFFGAPPELHGQVEALLEKLTRKR